MRFNENGQLLWSVLIGGPGDDELKSIRATSDGGCVAVGSCCSESGTEEDVLLVRLSPDGVTEWTRSLGTPERDLGQHVALTHDGGYILGVDSIVGDVQQWQRAVLIKTDAAGEIEWSKRYGGSHLTCVNFVTQTEDGGYVMSGGNKYGGAPGEHTGYLYRADQNGDRVWERSFRPTTNIDDDSGTGLSVLEAEDGGFLYGGQFWVNNNTRVVLAKLDSLGAEEWHRLIELGGGGPSFLTELPSGDFVVGTNFQGLLKVSGSGDGIWFKVYPDGQTRHVAPATDGYVLVGTRSECNDGYVVRVNSSGELGCDEVSLAFAFDKNGYDSPGQLGAPSAIAFEESELDPSVTRTEPVQSTYCLPASCTFRNGTGVNPTGFSCVTVPVIGMDWEVEVATTPTTLATYVAVAAKPGTTPVPGLGEILLGLAAPLVLLEGLGTHITPLPTDCGLIGSNFASQGLRLETGRVGPVAVLLNAQDLVVGN
ncbi:MAG: hypothetical protein AAF682_30165 [Planctomycetota bacterium]